MPTLHRRRASDATTVVDAHQRRACSPLATRHTRSGKTTACAPARPPSLRRACPCQLSAGDFGGVSRPLKRAGCPSGVGSIVLGGLGSRTRLDRSPWAGHVKCCPRQRRLFFSRPPAARRSSAQCGVCSSSPVFHLSIQPAPDQIPPTQTQWLLLTLPNSIHTFFSPSVSSSLPQSDKTRPPRSAARHDATARPTSETRASVSPRPGLPLSQGDSPKVASSLSVRTLGAVVPNESTTEDPWDSRSAPGQAAILGSNTRRCQGPLMQLCRAAANRYYKRVRTCTARA